MAEAITVHTSSQSDWISIKNNSKRLFDSGVAYYAFETTEELGEERKKARAEKRAYRYNRASLELSPETVEQFLAEGKPHVVRFKVPDGEMLTFTDSVLGDITVERF